MDIAIVGGSIAGCTTAIAAARVGLRPVVFERSTDALHDRGAGLGLPTATAIQLRDEGFIEDGFPHVSVRHLEHGGRAGTAGRIPTWLEGVRWGHLYSGLRHLVPENTYHAGVEVAAVEPRDGGAEIRFRDGSTAGFDLVVFADGYDSQGREQVSPGCAPAYQGYFLWRGVLPEHRVDITGFHETLQRIGYPGGHLFAYLLPGADGSAEPGSRDLNWGMFLPRSQAQLEEMLVDVTGHQRTLSLPPGSLRTDLEADLKREATDLLPQILADAVQATEDTFGQGILATLPDRYYRDRMCLVGDAGALIPPFTTSGVFKAMANATSLVAALSGDGAIEDKLQAWNAAQHATGQALGELSALMADRLIDNVPDFSAFDQAALEQWWQPVQEALQGTLS